MDQGVKWEDRRANEGSEGVTGKGGDTGEDTGGGDCEKALPRPPRKQRGKGHQKKLQGPSCLGHGGGGGTPGNTPNLQSLDCTITHKNIFSGRQKIKNISNLAGEIKNTFRGTSQTGTANL